MGEGAASTIASTDFGRQDFGAPFDARLPTAPRPNEMSVGDLKTISHQWVTGRPLPECIKPQEAKRPPCGVPVIVPCFAPSSGLPVRSRFGMLVHRSTNRALRVAPSVRNRVSHDYPAIIRPLRVSTSHPRYFIGGDGKAVLLTGSHTWNNLVDMGRKGQVVPFDWQAYLAFLRSHGHNFIRLWAYDSLATWDPADEVLDLPWERTGPGTALDGKPKVDLTRFDRRYFDRLRDRVHLAQESGIYVGVMLFDSWSNFLQTETPVDLHIFSGHNNVNGIDIVPTQVGGSHAAWCALADPAALAFQEAYVRRVVETVNGFDNVLFEISNEAGPESHAWQEHLTLFIRSLEDALPRQHPVGQTGGMGTSNRALHGSSADYVGPSCWTPESRADGYRTGHYSFGGGPFDRGDRPIVLDTDHLWGVGGDAAWAWKSFCRGYNPIYMDPWDDQPSGFFVHPRWPGGANFGLRREMGAIRDLSMAIDLGASEVTDRVSSTGYCLSVPGSGYVAFNPAAGPMTVDVTAGRWSVTWRDPIVGMAYPPDVRLIPQAGAWEFSPPFEGPSVLHLEALGQRPRHV